MRIYRNDTDCTNSACYCKVLAASLQLTRPLNDCAGCGCTWDIEPKSKWNNLRKAVDEYDAHAETLGAISTDGEFSKWRMREQELSARCGDAFCEATADINSRENAMIVRPSYWTQDDFIHRILKARVVP